MLFSISRREGRKPKRKKKNDNDFQYKLTWRKSQRSKSPAPKKVNLGQVPSPGESCWKGQRGDKCLPPVR
jgi:hypothetical protein